MTISIHAKTATAREAWSENINQEEERRRDNEGRTVGADYSSGVNLSI